MKLTITCLECNHKNHVERRIDTPSVVHIVCHKCEKPLKSTITERELTAAKQRVTA